MQRASKERGFRRGFLADQCKTCMIEENKSHKGAQENE
jgi:hypothetical protein